MGSGPLLPLPPLHPQNRRALAVEAPIRRGTRSTPRMQLAPALSHVAMDTKPCLYQCLRHPYISRFCPPTAETVQVMLAHLALLGKATRTAGITRCQSQRASKVALTSAPNRFFRLTRTPRLQRFIPLFLLAPCTTTAEPTVAILSLDHPPIPDLHRIPIPQEHQYRLHLQESTITITPITMPLARHSRYR